MATNLVPNVPQELAEREAEAWAIYRASRTADPADRDRWRLINLEVMDAQRRAS